MFDISLLCELCEISGVSGNETAAAELVAEKIKPYCDSLYIDKSGNLIAFKKGKKTPSKTVAYAAHLDEVGFMIRHINNDGTLLFESIGISPTVLPGKRVEIGDSKIKGVICSKPVHLMKKDEDAVTEENMYIDIGALSKDEAEKLGVYSAFATFENSFTVMGNKVMSKAIDDRFGCMVMMEMIKNGTEYDSYFIFTTGEELGGVGAIPAAREINPDTVFVFESTTASDIPSCKDEDRVCVLGEGAVVPFMDGGAVYDKRLYENVRKFAKDFDIKTQTKTKIAGGTDASSFQKSLSGIKVCAVSVPCRYIHTSFCVADISDMKMCLDLAKIIDKNLEEILG